MERLKRAVVRPEGVELYSEKDDMTYGDWADWILDLEARIERAIDFTHQVEGDFRELAIGVRERLRGESDDG